jgi:hypothetical protein
LFHPDVDRPKALAFPSEPSAGFAVLPQGVAEPLIPRSLQALRALDGLVRELGGKRYLSGFLFDMDPIRWRQHYEQEYDSLLSAKRELDPDNVFSSRLAPL